MPSARRIKTACLRAVLAVVLLQPSPPIALGTPRPRNALLVTADDLNGDSPGWMGGTAIRTPTLDALAAESHRFLNAHVTAPLCQPSRAALMTGRVPHRNGAVGFDYNHGQNVSWNAKDGVFEAFDF